jgi:uncharacterized membrane protein YraQ (UPF0718 family)
MKKFQFKGLGFLFVVLFIYCVLTLFDIKTTLDASFASLKLLYSLLPIFAFVIIITAIINYFVKPKQIIKHLGKDSGIRGIFYALISGVLLHGPMYMWYGFVQELRDAGAKDRLIIMFFFARAVKLPMLPFMIDLFGVAFAIILTLYTLLASVLQGYVYDYINKRI